MVCTIGKDIGGTVEKILFLVENFLIQLKVLRCWIRLFTLSCQLRDSLNNCDGDTILILLTLFEVKYFDPWSLLFFFISWLLLFTWCSLLSAYFSLVFARCSVIFVLTLYFRLFTRYFWLATSYFLPVARYFFSLYLLLVAC